MPNDGYSRWPSDAKIPLMLSLVDESGLGVVGAFPEVSIRRFRETRGDSLDNHFWAGLPLSSAFSATPIWLPLVEVDSVNSPGLYSYLFEQGLIGLEWIYHIYYRNLGTPAGFATETHIITNEVYVPKTQPDPVVIGPQSVMGQLELVKGLLHHNALLDEQQYEDGRLMSARLRVFDHPSNIPAVEGGNETAGLLAEFLIESTYDESGMNKRFTLKRLFP